MVNHGKHLLWSILTKINWNRVKTEYCKCPFRSQAKTSPSLSLESLELARRRTPKRLDPSHQVRLKTYLVGGIQQLRWNIISQHPMLDNSTDWLKTFPMPAQTFNNTLVTKIPILGDRLLCGDCRRLWQGKRHQPGWSPSHHHPQDPHWPDPEDPEDLRIVTIILIIRFWSEPITRCLWRIRDT